MGAPVTRLYADFKTSVDGSGAMREYWIKIKGCIGSDTSDAGVQNVIENPTDVDLLILEAIINVTTLTTEATDYDIGLGDNVTGGSTGAELMDGVTGGSGTEFNTEGIKVLGFVHSISAPAVLSIWKARNAAHTAVKSWIVCTQGGSVDSAELRFDLYVKVIPMADLV